MQSMSSTTGPFAGFQGSHSWDPLRTSTSLVPIAKCPACGCVPHDGGVGACPEVVEVEYNEHGHLKRFVKRTH